MPNTLPQVIFLNSPISELADLQAAVKFEIGTYDEDQFEAVYKEYSMDAKVTISTSSSYAPVYVTYHDAWVNTDGEYMRISAKTGYSLKLVKYNPNCKSMVRGTDGFTNFISGAITGTVSNNVCTCGSSDTTSIPQIAVQVEKTAGTLVTNNTIAGSTVTYDVTPAVGVTSIATMTANSGNIFSAAPTLTLATGVVGKMTRVSDYQYTCSFTPNASGDTLSITSIGSEYGTFTFPANCTVTSVPTFLDGNKQSTVNTLDITIVPNSGYHFDTTNTSVFYISLDSLETKTYDSITTSKITKSGISASGNPELIAPATKDSSLSVPVTTEVTNGTIEATTPVVVGSTYQCILTGNSGYTPSQLVLIKNVSGTETVLETSTVVSNGSITISHTYTEAELTDATSIIARGTVTVTPQTYEPASLNKINMTVYTLDNNGVDKLNTSVFIGTSGDEISKYIYELKRYFCVFPYARTAEFGAFTFDFGIIQPVVDEPEMTLDCGTVQLVEVNNNYTDYSPYVKVSFYLPFCGIVDIDTEEVMGKTINIKYKVNVYDKAICEIYADNLLIYTKSCILAYDWSATNSPTDGDVYDMQTQMLGSLIPTVTVTRYPVPDNSIVNELVGYPTYDEVTVGDVTGYLKATYVEDNGLTCTASERDDIVKMLKSGVLVN